ncbi:MAG: extracellular solute-binding protein [Clostridia bacterium]|nr:extracellular solute-binding protein [Clostridia bacterium]
MKRSFSFLMALIISICAVSVNLSVSADNAELENDAPNNLPTTGVSLEYEENSYEDYISSKADAKPANKEIRAKLDATLNDTPLNFTVAVENGGLFTIGMLYRALEETNGELELSLKIDGETPFAQAQKLLFPKIWCDDGGNRTDGNGNEFSARQKLYDKCTYFKAMDITKWTNDEYMVYLEAGEHSVTLTDKSSGFYIEEFVFGVPETLEKYKQPQSSKEYYKGNSIIIEGESAKTKTSYWLGGKTDNTSVDVTPRHAVKNLVNYIGGGNWKTNGETIVWETPELEAGYYQLGFSYRQNTVIGGKTYRALTIDGKVPFEEASKIGFQYDYSWKQMLFSDDNDRPYLFYFSKGRHEIGLEVVSGDIEEIRNSLKNIVEELGNLYIDITMITGENADPYRDYDLFSQIGDMEKRLKTLSKDLSTTADTLNKITGEGGGSNYSVIKNMQRVVDQMLGNRYSAHKYKSEYYTRYTALAATLYELKDMPLDLDKIALTAVGENKAFEQANFFESIAFSVQKFVFSFIGDYNNISGSADGKRTVAIWVNWGRDQAQVLNSLVQSSFTPESNISVNIKLVNASIVQALLSGNGPDCILEYSRSEPVNLAMRGALYNLSEFEDLPEVLERYQSGAETPYYYKGDLYALPDTQNFYLMFYRKDILKKMNLKVPETWDDFRKVVNLLARNNLSAWLPNNVATSTAQANAGIGSINIFPSILLQKGLSIYSKDGRSTNLADHDIVIAFNEWTDFYTKQKMPKTIDFYNRFRTGTCPIGIALYTQYTTFKAAAPEIDGLWGVAKIPGTVTEDGSVSHTSTGGGTACAILKMSKDPKAAWEFLKWWTSAETQLAYSNEIEAILGPTGRMSVANVEAMGNMSWDSEMKNVIMDAWEEVEEIPEYPGSYYVARSVYQSYWNVVDNNQVPNDVLLKYAKEADAEIRRKWAQYDGR